jgi:hypothetical protein
MRENKIGPAPCTDLVNRLYSRMRMKYRVVPALFYLTSSAFLYGITNLHRIIDRQYSYNYGFCKIRISRKGEFVTGC